MTTNLINNFKSMHINDNDEVFYECENDEINDLGNNNDLIKINFQNFSLSTEAFQKFLEYKVSPFKEGGGVSEAGAANRS
ncbi:hypothetical protein DDB_G0280601 [Dictyostelium discoideum AX4]|uniref:Uncharacterized protein n=1 Tax=Dictyostelium discoideum TaxID=44689 RepID=Q54V58_DICDI|nr:hypothetical protein DDB_G0280601 [Dictyostelium discoideum AX4]EAL67102.1 hypothetical protein DDB_G0280601 [Dictyostelium discoideum AX4]|eukprot:XP_641073.1 hypothetical protein DDB_G0280601 [Dictyostelium discoideum AX4]